MIRNLCYYGNPVLRKKARPVTEFNESLEKLVNDMIETMPIADGVGLAAPDWRKSSAGHCDPSPDQGINPHDFSES